MNDLWSTESPLERLCVPSAPEMVAAKLREAILSGVLKPGDRVIEQKWAARFGVGQPTLRDLELQGFVRKSRQRGTHVTDLSRDECRKLLEVRMALESPAIRLAASRITPAAIQELRVELERLEAAARNLDLGRFHEADMAFHKRIWELTGNEHLNRMLEQVAFGLFAFIKLAPPSAREYAAAVRQHREILNGLSSGNPETALAAFTGSTLKFWKLQRALTPAQPAREIRREPLKT